MEKLVCNLCEKNTSVLVCDQCQQVTCKSCMEFVDEDAFDFLRLLPATLQNKSFCLTCYQSDIDDKMRYYQGVADKALQVDIFNRSQSKETRLIKRVESPLQISGCKDQHEALLALAFMAADRGFNTLVDVDLRSKKIGSTKSHKKVEWQGVGTPVDPSITK